MGSQNWWFGEKHIQTPLKSQGPVILREKDMSSIPNIGVSGVTARFQGEFLCILFAGKNGEERDSTSELLEK